MEAASRGARQAGGKCVACGIRLSLEQDKNHFIDHSVEFRYFFVRKVMLIRNSRALVVLAGGLGTLDELFEVLTLIQTRKIAPLPIILVGKDYWQPLLDVIRWMVSAGTINADELERVTRLMLVTDDVNEMIAYLKTARDPLPAAGKSLGAEIALGRYSEQPRQPIQ
jgi:uncharacterized protein (TIGR00730 family)